MMWNAVALYLFLFGSSILENLFPPIPGDMITIFGAFLVGIGKLDFLLVFLVTTAGSTIGFIFLFYAGAFLEMEFFLNTRIKIFSNEKILLAEKWFHSHGYLVVLLNRFLPGIRSVISIVAGISGLSGLKVLFFASISALLWNFIWIYTGFTLGNNWETVYSKISLIIRNYNIAAISLFTVACIIYLSYSLFKRNRIKS